MAFLRDAPAVPPPWRSSGSGPLLPDPHSLDAFARPVRGALWYCALGVDCYLQRQAAVGSPVNHLAN